MAFFGASIDIIFGDFDLKYVEWFQTETKQFGHMKNKISCKNILALQKSKPKNLSLDLAIRSLSQIDRKYTQKFMLKS